MGEEGFLRGAGVQQLRGQCAAQERGVGGLTALWPHGLGYGRHGLLAGGGRLAVVGGGRVEMGWDGLLGQVGAAHLVPLHPGKGAGGARWGRSHVGGGRGAGQRAEGEVVHRLTSVRRLEGRRLLVLHHVQGAWTPHVN